MARFDLTDFEWSVIEPLLPNKSRGVPRVDDRRVLNGFSGGFAPVRLGPIFQRAADLIRLVSIASTGGGRLVSGICF